MKQILLFTVAVLFANYATAQQVDARSGATEITVNTGASYANEVYWDFETYNTTVALDEWDIAFTTDVYDVSLLINTAKVELYTYPDGDISDFANTLDISNIDNWTKMYNSIESWYGGAFVTNSTGHPDYGWGVYNMGTHNIVGDSIFIIKLASGAYKKLAIVEKQSSLNKYIFKYADLDGANLQEVTLNSGDYTDKNFIHYSIANDEIVEHEPAKEAWHLLFTRYYDTSIPYLVSGVLAKNGVTVQEVRKSGMEQATHNTYDENEFSENISTIGSDWKRYDFKKDTKGWVVIDTVVYYVKEGADGDIWKIYFTNFGGMANGEITFMQENLSSSSISNINKSFSTIHPNPANNIINIIYDIKGTSTISVYSISGKLVYNEIVTRTQNLNKHQIDISNFANGLYNVVIKSENKISTSKFIKN